MAAPLITVIIPVYNGETTVYATVMSVLAQSFTAFELIVIDDGSQDSTRAILAKIEDPRLSIHSFSNAGLSASRNRGIQLARADYISFIDADDLWTPDKLEAQYDALQREPAAAVCYSWTDFIDTEGNNLGYGVRAKAHGYVLPALLRFYFVGSGSNAIIRKEVFEDVGCFDESLTAMEDWDLFIRIAEKYPFSVVPHVQILYRIADDSLSSNVLRVEREMLKVVDRAYARQTRASMLALKKETLANLYLYLASRALKGAAGFRQALLATRFLWRAFCHSPRLLFGQFRFVFTLLLKMVNALLLPPQHAQAVRARIKDARRWRQRWIAGGREQQ